MRAEPLQPTRVHRFYRGGALLGRLRSEPEEDGFFPEDWLGSTTPASNPGSEDTGQGLSRLEDGRLLRDAIADDPIGWLGEAHVESFGISTALLVKLLDAAERLPVHAHPNDAFATSMLGSRFGKTEAWVVLATRERHAEVWVGLREPVAVATYRDWIERQDADSLLSSLNRVAVAAGAIVYVPAGLPHAIGAGILLAELQQPTDFSIICEWDGFPIRSDDAHLGLGWDNALEALDLSVHVPIRHLPDEARRFFWVDERPEAAGRFAVLVTVQGTGKIDGMNARAGDAFAVPASANRFDVEGDLRVLRCQAPDPN
jgi:mannose-6-phosphate isomerase